MAGSIAKRKIRQRHQQTTVGETSPIAMTLLYSDPKHQTVLIGPGKERADEIVKRPRFLELGEILRNGEHFSRSISLPKLRIADLSQYVAPGKEHFLFRAGENFVHSLIGIPSEQEWPHARHRGNHTTAYLGSCR